jgi:transposase
MVVKMMVNGGARSLCAGAGYREAVNFRVAATAQHPYLQRKQAQTVANY